MSESLSSRRTSNAFKSRRRFLQVGTLGALGLTLPSLLRSRAEQPSPARRARHCILLFLTGGPPQLDTFDLKPDAPAEIRGEFRPIATRVTGIRVGEFCPLLARQADKFCLVRSVTHPDTVHTSAGYTMLTGMPHPLLNSPGGARSIRPSANDHPHLGSLLSLARPARAGVPTFASLPEVIKDAGVNEFPGQGGGMLGRPSDPFRIEAHASGFLMPAIESPEDVPAGRLEGRQSLLGRLDSPTAASNHDAFYRRAFELIRSPGLRRAFRLEREPEAVRDAYGRHLFGQGCLLARRLVEAGVSLVTVYWHYEGPDDSPVWDTHQNNFSHLRNRLVPPMDRAVAALLEDLSVRGLVAETLVVCMGEFGRTPRINRLGGRDHWPWAQSVLLAGGGIRGGSVCGASDRHGAYPAELPITPADLAATILHLLGVPLDLELRDVTGRPLLACTGRPVSALVS
jgi:hypothetical protein